MVSRSLFAIFAVALFVASINAAPAQEDDYFELNDVVERGAIKEWVSKVIVSKLNVYDEAKEMYLRRTN